MRTVEKNKVIGRSNKVSLKTKIAFSSGSLEEAAVAAAGVATMIFYNQVLGGERGVVRRCLFGGQHY